MRENRTSGTVRGALGNRRSYREIFFKYTTTFMSRFMKTCIKFLIIIFLVFLHSSLNAASITGTIFHSDTTTPITTNGLEILVEAYSTQCPSPENCNGGCAGGLPLGSWVDSGTGIFFIHNIPAGSYFLGFFKRICG